MSRYFSELRQRWALPAGVAAEVILGEGRDGADDFAVTVETVRAFGDLHTRMIGALLEQISPRQHAHPHTIFTATPLDDADVSIGESDILRRVGKCSRRLVEQERNAGPVARVI